jgi:hypothetical protein
MKTKKKKNRKKKNSKKTTKKLLLVPVQLKKILKKNPVENTTLPTTDLTTLLQVIMKKKKDLKKPQLEDQDTLHLDLQAPVNKKVPTVPFPTTVTSTGTLIPPHGLNTRRTSWISSLD